MKNSTRNITVLAVMLAVIVVATLIDKAYSQPLVFFGGAALAVCTLVATVTSALMFNKIPYAIAAGAMFGLTSFVLSFIFVNPVFQNLVVSLLPRVFVGIIGLLMYRVASVLSKLIVKFAEKTHLNYVASGIITAIIVAGMVCFLVFGQTEGFVFFLVLSLFVLLLIFAIGLILAVVAIKSRKAGKTESAKTTEFFSIGVGAFFTVLANTMLVLPMMYLFSDKYETLVDIYAILTIANFLPELLITVILSPFVVTGVRRGLRLGIDGRPRYKTKSVVASSVNSNAESSEAENGNSEIDNLSNNTAENINKNIEQNKQEKTHKKENSD